MNLWTAILLGLVGSAHCAGMCGPLALALPGGAGGAAGFVAGRLAYNLGRVFTYAALGSLFGALGQTFVLVGLQRWLSILAGAAILLGLLTSTRAAAVPLVARGVAWIKARLGLLLRQPTVPGVLALGMLNGLLPCGLVYAACAGAAASGDVAGGTLYMAAFGAGTVPMLLGLGLAGRRLQFVLRLRLQRLVPVSLAVVGVLLLLRGLALGIPYVSPDLAAGTGACH